MDLFLKELFTTASVPGHEVQLRDELIEKFRPFGEIQQTKWTGFYCASKYNSPDKARKIVVTAHMDSPGFVVQEIKEDGKIQIISLGGIQPHLTQLRTVKLYTSAQSYPGILTLENENCRNLSPREAVYQGQFGFQSRQEAIDKGVKKGDSVCFLSPPLELENGFIAASHLDNRLGIYLLYKLAEQLQYDSDCNLYFAATSCEEVGGRCAKIMADMIQPDVAICLDVTYQQGSVKMGKGPVVTLSDDAVILPPTLRDTLQEIAQQKNLPVQFEVYNFAGTDAKDFRAAVFGGCVTIPVLIATEHNHSPHEVCALKDLQATRDFVLALIENQRRLVI